MHEAFARIMNEDEYLVAFVGWLNDQSDLILDPVCDLDPDEVLRRWRKHEDALIQRLLEELQ
jgi:hypothetical protein